MQENLSEATEKLASRLVEQWGNELRRSISDALQPLLEAEITRAGQEAAFVIASDMMRLLQAANQIEILSVLLQATQPFAARAGLLILRGGFFVGWQSRGMQDASAFTHISIVANDRVLERLGKERQPVRLQSSELAAFASAAPAGPGEVYLFPLLIRDRLAGILFADGGLTGSMVQAEVVQAMSLIACLAVETASLRKPAGSGAIHPAPPATVPEPARPAPIAAAQAEPPAQAMPAAEPVVAPPPVTTMAAAAVAEKPPVPAAALSPVSLPSDDLHAKARRFAKLLVEEIQLYNQLKVLEGRSRRDLYERLRPDIEKSRAAYQKRYGDVIRDVDYFSEELVRILANNDRSVLGSSFPG